jgi:hypothetical protein
MKKLFTIACTLVLGGALAFAQTGGTSGSTGGQTPAGDQTKTSASTTTTKKHHKHGAKKTKKSKKGAAAATTPTPAATPSPK